MASQLSPARATNRAPAFTVVFQDHGQDFLEWDLDVRGRVVASRPYQGDIWNGSRVLNQPEVGKLLSIKTRSVGQMALRYPVKSFKPIVIGGQGGRR